jgi:hypothetical protein
VGVHPDVVFTVESRVLNENASTGTEIQVTVGGEEAAVKEVKGFEDNEGANEGGFGCVVVWGKDGRQATRKSILKDTERKVRVRANTNCLTTGDEVGDPEVFGKLAVLGDDVNMVDGGEPERLDGGEQQGVVDKDCDRGDLDGEAGGYFVPRSILGTTESVDADVLVGVLIVLINARGSGKMTAGGTFS